MQKEKLVITGLYIHRICSPATTIALVLYKSSSTYSRRNKIINYCKNDYKNAMLYESPHDKHSVNTEKLSENRSITTTTVTNMVHCYESPHCKRSYYTANTNYFSFDIVGRVSIPVMTFKVTILHSSEPALIHYLNDWWVICN